MSSSTAWLSYLNTVPPLNGTIGANGDFPASADVLSEDLRAQLEAWTTVTFEDSSIHGAAGAFLQEDVLGELNKSDPSPYAKRPFGNFAHSSSTQLERGFNAFTPESTSLHNSGLNLVDGFNGLGGLGIGVHGSNTLFDDTSSIVASPHSLTNSPEKASAGPRTKKQHTLPKSPPVVVSTSSSESPQTSPDSVVQSIGQVTKQTILTKAAVLAAQAAELAAQKASTPEQEALRQAELNRVAAEDDKRRRNTAASARFRVKKKQREHALEDTVRELITKIDKLEKELDSTRIENNFLRDLIIRKVGLADLPVPSLPVPNIGAPNGRVSGGQEGATGMGTEDI